MCFDTPPLRIHQRPRVKRTLFIVLASLLVAATGQAQGLRPPADPPVTVVSITGIVNPVRWGEPPLPFAILERIERDPFLANMDTEAQVQTGPTLQLTFAFPSVEAYRRWAEAEGTRQLLQELHQRVSQLELTVDFRRAFGPGAGG
jgi:hypothetical protein